MPRARDLNSLSPDSFSHHHPEDQPKKQSKVSSSKESEFRRRAYDVLGHTKTPFSSFLVHPKVFTFEERDIDEEIILVLRRHWITNLTWIFITFFMILAPALLGYFPLLTAFPLNFQIIAVIFWYLITFAYAFEQFLTWYFNVNIITDERVIDIDFNNLLNKKFTEAKLSMIQDVTSHVTGVAQTVFDFGDVLIQTAAEIPEIVFDKVPYPQRIIKALHQLRQEEEQESLEGRIK